MVPETPNTVRPKVPQIVGAVSFGYGAAATIPDIAKAFKSLGKLNTPGLGDVFDVFTANLARTALLLRMPAEIAYLSHQDEYRIQKAIFTVTGTFGYLPGQAQDPAIKEKVLAEASKLTQELEKDPKYKGADYTLGCELVEGLVGRNFSVVVAIEALLYSVVVESWTIFESLASDLWVEALNSGPKSLAERVIGKGVTSRPDDLQGESETRSDYKSIPLARLKNYGYDLRDKMGLLLRRERKVDFQRLSNIKKGYEAAFGEEAIKLFDKPEYADIRALAAIRNLVAHRAGVVDYDYLKDSKGIRDLPAVEVGQRFPLTTPLATRLFDVALHLGGELLAFVNQKLAT